jgi:hypothetical protein
MSRKRRRTSEPSPRYLPRRQLSGKPRRRGNTYCAPFCGHGCTIAEHAAAVRGGAALASRLGEGWKPRVWENLGWHYSATSPCGQVKVHPSKASGFMSFFGSPDSSGGRWTATGRTPRAAVANVLVHVKAERDSLAAAVGRFEVGTKGWR